MRTYTHDRVSKGAKVFEAKDLENEPESHADASGFVRSELMSLGKRCGAAYNRYLRYASFIANVEESAFTVELSCGELLDDQRVSNLASLREQWHRAQYRAQLALKRFYSVCNRTKTKREALKEELASMRKVTSAEADYIQLFEEINTVYDGGDVE